MVGRVLHAAAQDLSRLLVLVTGAAGFIGMNLIQGMILPKASGGGGLSPKQVVGIDSLNTYYSKTLKVARKEILEQGGIIVHHGNLCDEELLQRIFSSSNFTHVVHLAAQAGVRYAYYKPYEYVSNNFDCFAVLLETIRKQCPKCYLVYASSSSVYGLNRKKPFSESDRTDMPAGFYGATKKSNELLAFSYYNTYCLHSTALRIFTVYGRWNRPDMAAYMFTHNIDKGLPIKLYEGGRMARDFTFIDDIVSGILSACQFRSHRDANGCFRPETFNLGNSHPVPVRDFIRFLEVILGKNATLVDAGSSPSEVEETYANISKAGALLGWAPRTGIEEGLRHLVQWYKETEGHEQFLREGDFHIND
ncbi:hypothetical protein GUITHDRAFT_158657 [Guillardia theta CCMP2712]|uniref:NAD(P)-binding domain-containing protein n=1 Tax=Guillardia theta (strain CCMP2712) TaxID=905079 RepID=L1ILS7_GUITC|nr:hypothetical protein GUITHDRAFT_158657 [Guillardia theta CCMP2712]EKX36750.1 hypothetical protein GUITHDRAFT_158657 [Guillardia theta CCMP2712]|eukprot:XP_005823730.1 hypothetical protein GUITHDRAFT_158657 [Guillardia theta CCMP2712]